MKYIVWGKGKRGRIIAQMLGYQNIMCFIDKNDDEKECNGIKVIKPEVFFEEGNFTVPVIVSPKEYEDEIVAQINQHTDVCYLRLSQYYIQVQCILKQLTREIIEKNLSKDLPIYIQGFNIAALALYERLETEGYDVSIIEPDSMEPRSRCVLDRLNTVYDRQEIESGQIILTEEAEIYVRKNIPIIKLSQFLVFDDAYINPKLEMFKNIHRNDKCFIVATGPSLKVEDLDILHKNHVFCLSMNSIFKIFEKTEWRPNYYVISDPIIKETLGCNIREIPVEHKFIADVCWFFDRNEIDENMYKWHLQMDWNDNELPKFSDNFAKGSYWGRTVTYDGAIQLAVYMGFKEIYLLGTDCNYIKGSKKNHFIDEEKEDRENHGEDDMIKAYMSAKAYGKDHGIKIYNATRGGKLEVFERVNFDDLF